MSDFTMKLRNGTIKSKLIRTASSNSVRQKYCRRRFRETERDRKCICIPQRYGLIEYPLVWTDLRNSNQLCDGTIICNDGVEIRVHRVILAAVSSYFKLFCILKPKVPLFLNSLGKLIEHVKNKHFPLDQLKPTNCLGILRFARHYFCSDLEKKGKSYVRYNFVKLLTEGKEFETLNINEVVELLKDDELNVRNEEFVYGALQKWVKFDPEGRKCYLLTLLKCVRLGTLSCDFLYANVMKWELISQSQECRDYLMSILSMVATHKERIMNVDNPLMIPRVPYDILFAVGGWSAGSPTNFIETYDTRADRWLLSRDLDKVPRAYHGVCAVNGCLYMIGGFDGNEHFNTVRCYDPVHHKWTDCACMYNHRCYVSVVMHDNKIYAMGGFNGRGRMNSVERYDPRTNQWEIIKPMKENRSDASAATLNDKIYIVGGFNGQVVMNSGEVYDVFTNQWTAIPNMLSARSGVSLIAYKDTLYAMGGFNGYTRLTSGEKFTPSTSANWTDIAEMYNPRSNFATVVLDDLIFVIGGFNGSTTISYVECYDTDANEWFDVAPMNLNRSALSACVLSGLPNARDYSLIGRSPTEVGQGAGAYESICME